MAVGRLMVLAVGSEERHMSSVEGAFGRGRGTGGFWWEVAWG